MIKYNNYSGMSSVDWYEIGDDFIRVKFFDKEHIYTYSYEGKAGQTHVEELKRRAQSGNGLHSYIMMKLRLKHD